MKSLSECTVLIVDDTEENIDILVEALGDEYEISVAMDGETALDSINMEIPDIILLDIMMPGMDGYEVCKEIKSNEKTKEIPIIFLTAMTDINSKAKAFEFGAVDYITKPFEIIEVRARVHTQLCLKLAKYELIEKNNILIDQTYKLQEAMDELEVFSHTVSHDLKTPLRAIEGYSDIMIEDYSMLLDDEGKRMLVDVKKICNNAISMIEKLLQYSSNTSIDIHKERIDMKEMFTSVFLEIKSSCQQRKIEFEFETGMPYVFADIILIKEVIYNIISNAVKFTKNNKKAYVIAGCKKNLDEYVFYVRDNGVGIDMKHASKLFNIFQRLHSKDEYEGSGVGLASIKKIIQKHGGKTWIEGKVNEGTTIYFTLPQIN